MMMHKKLFVKYILLWYEDNKRCYDWRYENDAYKIWIAETLLQRTRADFVQRVYANFMTKYPKVQYLSKSTEKDVSDSIKQLGLHQRIPRIIEGAKYVTEKYNGKFPKDAQSLKKIPGVGDYIANCILAFSYNMPVAIVDVNIVRILSRFFNINSLKKKPDKDPIYSQFLNSIIPKNNIRNFLFGLLDYSHIICNKHPLCHKCKINCYCENYSTSV